MTIRNSVVGFVGGAVIAGALSFQYSHKRFPFGGADQPILISDSSVDVRINGSLNPPGKNYNRHRILGKRFDHVVMVDSKNNTSTPICSGGKCDQTAFTFFLANDEKTFHTITIMEVNTADTDLVVDAPAWNTNFWYPSTLAGGFTTLSLNGGLVVTNNNHARCQYCTYYLCFPSSASVDGNCAQTSAK
jgi:hypothetical protein